MDAKTVKITELPVGTWTDDYKEFLEKLIEGDGKKKKSALIKEYVDMCTDKLVDITVTFNRASDIQDLISKSDENDCNGLEKYLRLYTTQTTTNMHMFDEKEKLRKFDTPQQIIDYFYEVRQGVYVARKIAQVSELESEACKLSNKAKYIMENLSGEVDLRRKKNDVVTELLEGRGYDKIDDSYNYLTKMPMDSVIEENVDKLLKQKGDKDLELQLLMATTESEIWSGEIAELEELYANYIMAREKEMQDSSFKPKKLGKKKLRVSKKK